MKSYIYVVASLFLAMAEPFFLWSDKHGPIWFCIKICPLYCSPRRSDEDASSLIYIDHEPYFDFEDFHPHPYNAGHYKFCKWPPKPTPKPTTTTTTTMAPSTEAPTLICEVCMKKCGFPNL